MKTSNPLYEFFPNLLDVSEITWADVVDKVDYDVCQGTWGYTNDCTDDVMMPTIVCEGYYLPESMAKVADEMYDLHDIDRCHLYVSFARQTQTYGRHNDTMDVVIVGAIGTVSYAFDDGEVVTVQPGDALFIPAGVYHDPASHTHRATLSFSREIREDGNV